MTPPFRTARPIWPSGRSTEMNRFVGFRAVLPATDARPVTLRVAASSVYRVFVDGAFVGHGPARGPHGRFRVDEWALDEYLGSGGSLLAIEAVGYNVNSYYLLDQPAFVLAEVLRQRRGAGLDRWRRRSASTPSCSTTTSSASSATASRGPSRRRSGSAPPLASGGPTRPPRQRPSRAMWARCLRSSPAASRIPISAASRPFVFSRRGRLERGAMPEAPYRDWTLTGLGPDLKGYPEDAFEVAPSLDWQAVRTVAMEPADAPLALPLDLSSRTFQLLDFGVNQTGFIGLRLRCAEPTRFYALFDEILTDGDVDPRRLRCLNILDFQIEPGTHEVETFEPYTLRYLKLAVLEGACAVEAVGLRTVANPEAARASFASGDADLDRLFEAGRETLRQNAVDLLMDCPSRERAGWPCDSFFTARAAALLTGNTSVERAFLENYLLAPPLDGVPEGMLPMNYPADHPNGDFLGERDAQFIPNWPLWLVLQLEEYLWRSGDRALVEAFEPRVRDLFGWFEPYVNEDGLLEDLDGWVFLEWSKANEFVTGVNYPTNMLWAAALDAAGRLYDVPAWRRWARPGPSRRRRAGLRRDVLRGSGRPRSGPPPPDDPPDRALPVLRLHLRRGDARGARRAVGHAPRRLRPVPRR